MEGRPAYVADAEMNYGTVTRWTLAVIVIAVAIGLMLEPG